MAELTDPSDLNPLIDRLHEQVRTRVHAEALRVQPLTGPPITDEQQNRAASLVTAWLAVAALHRVAISDIRRCVNIDAVCLDSVRYSDEREARQARR